MGLKKTYFDQDPTRAEQDRELEREKLRLFAYLLGKEEDVDDDRLMGLWSVAGHAAEKELFGEKQAIASPKQDDRDTQTEKQHVHPQNTFPQRLQEIKNIPAYNIQQTKTQTPLSQTPEPTPQATTKRKKLPWEEPTKPLTPEDLSEEMQRVSLRYGQNMEAWLRGK